MKISNLLSIVSKISLLGGCLFLFSCHLSPSDPDLTASLVRVVSGQTLEVNLTKSDRDKITETVRLIGIAAPDLRQSPWGEAARNRLKELVASDNSQSSSLVLELDTQSSDRYGRLLAHVWHNGTLVSEQLVREGYVLADLDYPHQYSQRFVYAQEYARLMGFGVWNPQQPMGKTPNQFRSRTTQS